MVRLHNVSAQSHRRSRRAAFVGALPGPSVAKEQLRQDVQDRGLRATIGDRQPNQHIIGRRFGILGHHVEVSRIVKGRCVGQFVFGFGAIATATDVDQLLVGIATLRVLVQRLHVAVRRRAIEIVVALFDVFAVIAFGSGDAEQSFFQDRIATVPKPDRKTESTFAITDPQQAVFAPAVGAAAGVIVRKIAPRRVAALAVVLANGAPLAFGQVGSPTLPVLLALFALMQSFVFGSHGSVAS